MSWIFRMQMGIHRNFNLQINLTILAVCCHLCQDIPKVHKNNRSAISLKTIWWLSWFFAWNSVSMETVDLLCHIGWVFCFHSSLLIYPSSHMFASFLEPLSQYIHLHFLFGKGKFAIKHKLQRFSHVKLVLSVFNACLFFQFSIWANALYTSRNIT